MTGTGSGELRDAVDSSCGRGAMHTEPVLAVERAAALITALFDTLGLWVSDAGLNL